MRHLRGDNGLIILTYHSIDESGSAISVSPAAFEHHMRCLKKGGYHTLPLGEAVGYLEHNTVLPEKSIVIAFDDGYKNNYTSAFPILKRHGFTAVIFLTSNHLGKINNWPNQHPSIPSLQLLSWDEIREMIEYGIEFGAHTRSHPLLTEVDTETAREEIIGSKRDIEAELKRPIDFFSYPFGKFNERVREIAAVTFKCAISTKPGKINFKSDMYALERINAAGMIFRSLPFKVLSFRSFDMYLILKRFFNKSKKLRVEG